MSKTAITPTREENFSDWYQNVIVAAGLAENSPVRGCMTFMPYGWAIWELIRNEMDKRIKAEGVQNACFPLLIPTEFLSREAEHVDGFAKECAVVTHHRLKMIDGKLQPDPDALLTDTYVIRPTSETIIGEAMSRWVQSYRDLPMKLNQWVNVMRWEMRTRMFLRTSEFYWQEGHNAFASADEARSDARKMHAMYQKFFREILALEPVMGEKVPEERFAGADNSYSLECIMQDGKALQAGTSHYLGQHFSNAMNIKYLGADGELHLAHTTSWGVSTRMMGGIIMSHSDDDGLVLPPAIAPYQVVIIPIMPEQNEYAREVAAKLDGLRVFVDDSDARSSDKMWKWIKKGVPLRVEVGAKEQAAGAVSITRRDIGKASQKTIAIADLTKSVMDLLQQMQKDLLSAAAERNGTLIHNVKDFAELESALMMGKIGFFRLPYAETKCEEFARLMEEYKISWRCLDDADDKFVFVAKSY
ncbi:MAG: proline--tRNA ligase [Rickettsiales bacterium]|jgi:prolyl-tRNA synthetase|nr:proline--tRNA ligase [Rickettsiales bacterium]